MTALDWDSVPRLLHDLCDGHPGFAEVLYRLDRPGGGLWLCQACFLRALVETNR